MIYGAIAEGGGRWYTDLSEVFAAAGDIQEDYDWLVTDWEAYGIDELEEQGGSYRWLTGAELAALLEKYRDRQWIWGVLSGFRKGIQEKDVLSHPLPYADGYEGFWKVPLSLQHPLVEIEIVPWDSSLVLFLAKEQEIVDRFRKNFLPNQDLLQYIEGLDRNGCI